jgi:PAS domain S-box-containing protein
MGIGSAASVSGAASNDILGALAARHVPSAAVVLDTNCTVQWASEAALRLFGSDLVHHHFNVHLVDGDAADRLHLLLLQPHLDAASTAPLLVQFRDANGRPFPALVSSTPLAPEATDAFLVTVRPRSEQHDVAGRAKDPQRALVCEFTPHGLVVRTNGRFRTFLGLERSPVGANLDELMDHATGLAGQHARTRHRVLADLRVDLATGNLPPATYLNGRTVEWTYTSVDDIDGSLLSVLAVGHDVTERLRGQQVQRLNEERYRAIVDNINDTVIILAADGTVLETNAGRDSSPDDATVWKRTRLIEALHPDDRNSTVTALQSLIDGSLGDRQSLEARAADTSGQYVWVELNGINLLDEPSIGAVLITIRNVDSQRAAARQLEQANAAQQERVDHRQRFLGVVSHELRNLVHGTLGLTEALDGVVADQTASELTGALVRHAGTLRRVVDDLLDYSTITDGRVHVERTVVDLDSMLRDLGEANRPNVLHGVDLRVAVPDPALRQVQGDHHRLRQALQNLVSNAILHTETGSITLSARAGTAPDTTRIEVRDTGSGIDPTVADRLFLPYVRGHRERSPGTGLGLTIAKLAVELMNGTIGVERRADGTTFWIEMQRVDPAQPDEMTQETAWSHGDLELLDVLVIDDNPVNLLVASMQLDDCVRRVQTVSSVADALAAIRREHFDVVLCDLHLSGETGFDFLHAATSFTGDVTYIVMMTGDTDPSVAAQLLAAGAHDFLHKPASRRDMQLTVQRACAWLQESSST